MFGVMLRQLMLLAQVLIFPFFCFLFVFSFLSFVPPFFLFLSFFLSSFSDFYFQAVFSGVPRMMVSALRFLLGDALENPGKKLNIFCC